MDTTKRFNRDSRVIGARRNYRADLKRGIPETLAWERANQVYRYVRTELDTQARRQAMKDTLR